MYVALVTDNTPRYLEYGSYRGWVLLDEKYCWVSDLTYAEVAEMAIEWDVLTDSDYARSGTVL